MSTNNSLSDFIENIASVKAASFGRVVNNFRKVAPKGKSVPKLNKLNNQKLRGKVDAEKIKGIDAREKLSLLGSLGNVNVPLQLSTGLGAMGAVIGVGGKAGYDIATGKRKKEASILGGTKKLIKGNAKGVTLSGLYALGGVGAAMGLKSLSDKSKSKKKINNSTEKNASVSKKVLRSIAKLKAKNPMLSSSAESLRNGAILGASSVGAGYVAGDLFGKKEAGLPTPKKKPNLLAGKGKILGALGAGTGVALGGKYLYDKYNEKNEKKASVTLNMPQELRDIIIKAIN